jgi:DNA polymerase-3 subunit alpha
MLTLIEAYSMANDPTIDVEEQVLPCRSVVEDEDGVRLFVTSWPAVSEFDWDRAYGAGAMAVILSAGGPQSMYMLAETFARERTLIRTPQGPQYTIDENWWIYSDHVPRWREMVTTKVILNTGFVSLHTHTEFSGLDGLTTVEELVQITKDDGQGSVAVTDHGVCSAHPILAQAAQKMGLKAIYGQESYFCDDRLIRAEPGDKEMQKSLQGGYHHLILWAMNNTGLRNLWAASTQANRTGFYYRPRMDWRTLEEFNEGIMCSTACFRGPIGVPILADDEPLAQMRLGRLLDIFGDRLYIELHTNHIPDQIKLNHALVDMANTYSVPTIAVVDSHYACSDDKRHHQVWIASQTNKDLQDEPALFDDDADYHVMSAKEVAQAIDYLPGWEEAISNTVAVAERCDAVLGGTTKMPIFSRKIVGVPNEDDQARILRDLDRLVELCFSNWARKCVGKEHPEEEYIARFEREMGLLISKNFLGYYLIVSDYVRAAKAAGILIGCGRGSGSASLVSYLADITEIDPIEYDLLFERFLTEGRGSPPDFDVDFPASKRDWIEGFVSDRWGADHVVRVGTHIRLKNKGVIRDLARVLKNTVDIDYRDIDAISKTIDVAESDTAGKGHSWEALWTLFAEDLDPYRLKYPVLFDHADRIVGRLKSYGKHAAGVCISTDEPLVDSLPLRMAGDQLVSEYDMNALEALGLPKFDLLTLRTLDTLQMCIDLIAERHGDKVNVYDWVDEYRDPLVWDQISDGYTIGIFQIETRGGTRLTRRFRPQSVAELGDVITLIRPGPMRSGLTETYLRRRAGQEEVSFADDRLAAVLARSQGVVIYQEQVMSACQILAGYTLNEADAIRKLLGKKQTEKVVEVGREFVQRCVANGMELRAAEEFWSQLAEFAKYGFNVSHAIGYAIIGFWCSWFKAHYGVEFLTAALSTVDKDRIPEFINEARRMGYKVLPPDVNESGSGFTPGDLVVRYGLDSVKGIGEASVKALIEGQPYSSFEDFMARRKVNIGVVKLLARIGALDSLHPNRRALEAEIEILDTGLHEKCVDWDLKTKGPNALPCRFDWTSEPVVLGKKGQPLKGKPIPKACTKACRHYRPVGFSPVTAEPYTKTDIQDIELEHLGVYLTTTPFDLMDPDDLAECHAADEIDQGPNGKYMVAGVMTKVRMTRDRHGNDMGFATFLAQNGTVDITIFKDAWKKYVTVFKVRNLYVLDVVKTSRGIHLDSLLPL